jgi:sigma-B regulation protein RsbU (phosphoserine phosphatase)
MLTASFDEQSLVAAMEAGVDDFLPKPLRPAELGARLRAAERVLALESQMAARNRELSDAYAQLSRDLELARALQIGQLPPAADFGPLRLDGMFEASSFVGGDLYDWFGLGERLLAFYLADVSGHGVAAAMMAVSVRAQLKAVTQQVAHSVPPDAGLGGMAAQVVGAFNRRFLQTSESGLYLTLVYGLVDRASGHAALVHAGHPPALLSGPGDTHAEPVGEPSLPVGILEDAEYEARLLTLAPGSRLVLYSDGITDCAGVAGEPFGDIRLRALLARERASAPAVTCAAVRDELRGWRGGSFEDDVTLLVLESR